MDAGEALARRRSCRSYSDQPVEPGLLFSVLDGARRGPSAGNTWALDLVVLNEPEALDA
ncbi:MAG: nitroreductase family protein, partial [Actinobacteria bacterium]|nr:nitroreductase family protein [Actinomycetota bacterium]